MAAYPGLLSAVMIVKDEAPLLGACLESIRPVVDEIVVLDTGSKDESIEIAKAFRARVFHSRWTRNFSAARNAALVQATGEWILSIDADERLMPVNRAKIEEQLRFSDQMALKVRYYPQSGYTPFHRHLLFKNDSRIQFHGIIHESITPSLHSHALPASDECALGIVHLDSIPRNRARKDETYLPLLEKEIALDPCNSFCRWHLGNIYKNMSNMQAAVTIWQKAVDMIREKDHRCPIDSLSYIALIHSYAMQDRVDQARSLLDEALASFPDNCLLLWLKGRFLMQTNQFSAAIPCFTRLSACSPDLPDGGYLAYEQSLFTIKIYDALAQCYYKCGRYHESLYCLNRCIVAEPDRLDYKIRHRYLSTLIDS